MRIDGEVEPEVCLAGDTDLATHEPVHQGIEVHRSRLDAAGHGKHHGEGNGVLVAEVHERPEGESGRDGELQGTCRNATGQVPVDVRRLAGVASIDPVHMPIVFKRQDQTSGDGAARSHGRGE